MAVDPDNPRLTPEERRRLEKERLDRSDAGGRSLRLWWLWLIVLFGIVWFAGWGWRGYGGWFGWGGRRVVVVQRAANPQNPPGNSPNQNAANKSRHEANSQPAIANVQTILNSPDKRQFAGTPVNLEGIQVQAVDSDGTIWVGLSPNEKILVVPQGAGSQAGTEAGHAQNAASAQVQAKQRSISANLRPGEMVSVEGTVETVASASQAQQKWNLNQQEAQQVEQQGVLVAAQSVVPIQRP